MAGVKHAREETESSTNSSPYISQFTFFRTELDAHHDRRERITKASRDITALSKKIIFSLQRVRTLAASLPPKITSDIQPHYTSITTLFTNLTPDLAGPNAQRYARQISPALQEYVEAVTFQHYLTTGRLLSWQEARGLVPEGIVLGYEDWVLGVFDVVGEVMRFAVTAMAVTGEVPRIEKKGGGNGDVATDLRMWRAGFEGLDIRESGLNRSVEGKMAVMRSCVEKVERAMYGMIIRGRERPKGWVPDLGPEAGDKREVVEGY